MAAIYDYVVTVKVTRPTGENEKYDRAVQAYNIQDAMMQALIDLDTEHNTAAPGCTAKILSIRPDVDKVASTNALLNSLAHVDLQNAFKKKP